MRVGQKQQSSVDMRVRGLEPGVGGAMWVGGVSTDRSVHVKVGSVDTTSSIVMWVNGTAQERVQTRGWVVRTWVAKQAWGLVLWIVVVDLREQWT